MPYARFRFKNIPKIEGYDVFNNVFLNKSYAWKLWKGDVYFPRKYNYGNYTFDGTLNNWWSHYDSPNTKIWMELNIGENIV